MKQSAQILVLVFLGILAAVPWWIVIILGVLAPLLGVMFLLYCVYAMFRYTLFGN